MMSDDKKMNGTGYTNSQDKRPTIGLLLDNIWDPIAWDVWAGVNDATKEADANLLCFVGGAVRSRIEFTAQSNVLYDLVGAQNVDGLVIWGGGLGQFISPEEMIVFCEQYHPLPMVNAALPLEGVPSILVDNYEGMRDAMIHLTEVHGYRRIAFVRGPEGHPEADERYRAYTTVLAEHGLAVDLDLVAPGNFHPDSGTKAIHLLLDQRKLQPKIDFEAIVAVDDGSAISAMEELQARGVRVPDDVAVVGFDNIEEGRYVTPPLTTAPSLVYEQGQRATAMVLTLLEGGQVPERVILPTQVVVRQSCGCVAPAVAQAAVGKVPKFDEAFEVALATRRQEILSEMVQAVEASLLVDVTSEWAEQLLDTFVADLKGGTSETFVSTLNEILRQAMGGNVAAWQGALSVLRYHALPYLNDQDALSQAEDLWQQARVVIGEAAQRAQAYQRLQTEQKIRTLSAISQVLGTTFDVPELVNVLTERLPDLDIECACISLYDDSDASFEWSKLVLAYSKEGNAALEGEGRRFSTRQLVPDGLLPRDKRYSMVVEPLYFQENQLGLAVFKAEPQEAMIYDALRGHISSALKGALLLRERTQAQADLQKAYAEVEKKVEERTAELHREVAERERVQEESLRLQQQVIEAQKEAIQELSTPVIPIMDRIIVMPLVGSIDSMRARDITRSLLAGIRQQRAKVVILDITGVPLVDSGVANHLNKTIQAARLKGAHTIITGISDAVAETIVDLGIDWSGVETVRDLRTGLITALESMGTRLMRSKI
ncbi:MAG: substrate-binding domain-containing protein [Chloroflexi bacterium]|nr:substrate-binding domain-containing protein [Chloroflexota bacterium]